MNETINIVRLRQPDEFDDTLRGVLRGGMRRLLAQALEMEAEAFLAARRPRCARNLRPTASPL
jgi:putative transposase